MSRPPTPAVVRMAALVVDHGDCLVFTGNTNEHGYGRLRQSEAPYTMRYVHLLKWTHYNGPVPEGMEIDHTCGNRRCVALSHLEAVTHAENMRRMVARRRAA